MPTIPLANGPECLATQDSDRDFRANHTAPKLPGVLTLKNLKGSRTFSAKPVKWFGSILWRFAESLWSRIVGKFSAVEAA
jgi:hypothetical protein